MRNRLFGRAALALAGAAATFASACVERAPELSPADRERLREYVSREAPSPEHELGVQFENGVELLGYDVSAESARPGQPVTVTWYWHATEELDDGWRMFTHVADADDESRLNQDNVGVIREIYQPGRWEAGDYIRDVQQVTLPEDWNSDRVTFYLGLWNDPHRLAITEGSNDGENRVRALSLPVVGATSASAGPNRQPAEAASPLPSLRAARLEGELAIDGRLDEDAWGQTPATRDFVNPRNGQPAELEARAKMLWDDEHLYVAFDVADDFVRNDLEGEDAHLWEQDAVEVMIDPDGDGRNYYEVQVSPTGQVFDTRYDTRRQPQPFGHLDWDSQAEAAARVQGTANDDEADQRYTVEIALPWSAFEAARPEPNSAWQVNLYVMDARRGDAPQRGAGWSATHTGDFHVPTRFGRVLFGAPMQAAAAPEATGSEGEGGEASVQGLRPIPLPPAAAAALRDSVAAGNVPNPRSPGALLDNPETARQLREALQARREQRGQR